MKNEIVKERRNHDFLHNGYNILAISCNLEAKKKQKSLLEIFESVGVLYLLFTIEINPSRLRFKLTSTIEYNIYLIIIEFLILLNQNIPIY